MQGQALARQSLNGGEVDEIPVPVAVIVTVCVVLSPKAPVATPDEFVGFSANVAVPGLPVVFEKNPLPEFERVNTTPAVGTALPNWSSSCRDTVTFVVV